MTKILRLEIAPKNFIIVAVSRYGEIFYCGKEMRHNDNGNGYKSVIFSKTIKGIRFKKRFYVHRLVAEAYCKNPLNLKEVNHIDLDKGNNIDINLVWCDRKQNQIHASRSGVFSGRNNSKRAKKLTYLKATNIRKDFSNGLSISSLSVKFRVSRTTISRIIRKIVWK